MSFTPSNFPSDWYWISADGKRGFASARCAVVGPDDAGLAAFKAAGFTPSRWPTDAEGAESDAEMDAVLRPYGLSTGGPVRSVQAYILLMAIPEAQRDTYGSAVKGWDQRRMSARGSDLIPENSPLVARIAPKISLTPKAWFDLAIGVTAS